ncbi:MAG: LytR/AlgR family response regulator transcription factor [Gemmatimonadaceae bacterium]
MARYKILVVDDEPLARQRLLRLLATSPECDVSVAPNGEAALDAVRQERPDIVFLDIQMPGMDGFTFLERVGDATRPVIVFVTAFAQHALRAFDAEAIDYLVKPFDDARFAASLARAQAMVNHRRLGAAVRDLVAPDSGQARLPNASGAESGDDPTELEIGERGVERVLVRMHDRLKVIPVTAIDWIAAEGNYVRIIAGKDHPLHRSTLAEFETRLDPARFVRVHRSAIVNVERVRELREVSRGEYAAVLTDGTKLKVSRARRPRLELLLGGTR